MRPLLIAMFLLAATLNLSGQDLTQLKSVLPPSPTASSLGKYADWPVSLFTGVPSISVPLYEVRSRAAVVPITLNYHASGIKVSEVASWVGLGFSLDAGGVITRSVRGMPDDNGGYLLVRNGYTDRGDLTSAQTETPVLADSLYRFKIAAGTADPEPDLYMLNAMGKSFKFLFAGDGTIITQPRSNVRIENEVTADPLHEGDMMEWMVTLEDGTKLLFGGVDCVEYMMNAEYGPATNGTFQVITSWYLRQIIDPTGDVIDFTYAEESYRQPVSFSQSENKPTYSGYNPLPAKNSYFRPDINGRLLSKIKSSSQVVEFDVVDREDVEDANRLAMMSCYSRSGAVHLKKFTFNYEYSSAVSGSTFGTDPGHNKRLRLTGVTESSYDNGNAKPWTFEYNTQNLPSRASYAQDHWGYFNGKTSNSTMLPLDPNFGIDAYGDREPDSAKMMAEMLVKVNYPTQGYSLFNYEPNSVEVNHHHYTHTTDEVTESSPTFAFSSPKLQVVTLNLMATFHDYEDIVPHLAWLRVKNSSGQTIGSPAQLFRGDLNVAGHGETAVQVLVQPGSYTLELIVLDPATVVSIVDASMTYDKDLGQWVSPQMVGGVRVASIQDFDGISGNPITRSFRYESPVVYHDVAVEDYQTMTTARNYTCAIGMGPGNAGFSFTDETYYTRFSNVRASLGTAQGGSVGYGKVSTLYGLNGENGKTVSYFSVTGDVNPGAAVIAPYIPVDERSWRRGLLREQRDYDADDVLLRKETTSYSFTHLTSIKGIKPYYPFSIVSACLYFQTLADILDNADYTLSTEQVQRDATRQVMYFARGSGYDSTEAVQNFYYDTPGNTQATRTVTTNSKGQTITQYQRTALESSGIHFAGGDAAAQQAVASMRYHNKVGIVVETEEFADTTLVSRLTTNFKKLSDTTRTVPRDVMARMGGAYASETRVQFTNYDSYGNLLEQQKTSDVVHSYLYDYNSQVPIAEAVNAPASSIAYTSFEADGTGNWTVSVADRDSSSSYTGDKSFVVGSGKTVSRTGLSASVSYLVSYWAKNSASILVNGSSPSVAMTRGAWNLYVTVVSSVTSLSITGTGSIDEVRLHPVNAQMVTCTYKPWLGKWSETDANHSTVYYDYDLLQRPVRIKDDEGNVLKMFNYHYKGQ